VHADSSSLSRRRYLVRLGTATGVAAVAGCSDDADARDETAVGTTTTVATDDTPSSTEGGRTDAGATPTTTTGTPIHPGYETTEVRVTEPDGTRLGSVTAAIADTPDLRYTGLSDTESLPEDRGMLFVYDEERESLTYVMRRMDFGIDIVFADSEGVITRIHNAPAPGPEEDGSQQGYSGSGQYVLEVNFEWTTERGIEDGDVLTFEP